MMYWDINQDQNVWAYNINTPGNEAARLWHGDNTYSPLNLLLTFKLSIILMFVCVDCCLNCCKGVKRELSLKSENTPVKVNVNHFITKSNTSPLPVIVSSSAGMSSTRDGSHGTN